MFQKLNRMNRKKVLAALWLFAMLNYIYADILTVMDPSVMNDLLAGTGDVPMTPGFMLAAAILMELPIAMVILSLILDYSINRWANIIVGVIKTLAVFGTMFVGVPAPYYLFFGTIEILTTLLIVWYAWSWKPDASANEPALM